MPLTDLLKSDHNLFLVNQKIVQDNTPANSDNRQYALQALRGAFVEAVAGLFDDEFKPIVKSAASVADRLTRLISAQANQAQVIRNVFPDEVDRTKVTTTSVLRMQEALKAVFS